MIVLKDPGVVEAGTIVCVTATNVGSGAQFRGNDKLGVLNLRVTVNLIRHTAKICFTAPALGGMVRIFGADLSGTQVATLSILVKL